MVIIIGEYLVFHLIVSTVRGVVKWNWIQTNVYDYYDSMTLSYIGKIIHHIKKAVFNRTTFIISIILTLIIITIFHLD